MIVLLILSTIVTILFIVQLFRGSKYDELLEGLEGDDYPIKEIYGVGYAWAELPFLKMPADMYGKISRVLRLVEDEKYIQYYANVVWAQMITFVHLMIAVGCIAACFFRIEAVAVFGIVAGVVMASDFYNSVFDTVKKRRDACEGELAEVVSTMALLVNSGMVLKEAWRHVAYSRDEDIYKLMKIACDDMDNGYTESDAIYKFAVMSDSAEIKKFASMMIQGIEKGSRELAEVLALQSEEMWNVKRQYMLQKGEKAASALLIPITLIFVSVILLVAGGASGMLTSMG